MDVSAASPWRAAPVVPERKPYLLDDGFRQAPK